MHSLSFTNRKNHEISAILHPSKISKTDKYAIFAHCFTCGKNINAAVNIANQLAALGINVLRFDFTGIGASEGKVTDAYFTSTVNDLVDAADFLRNEYDAPSLMIGHSLGGTAAIVASAAIPEIKAVATIGAPAHSGHIIDTLGVDQDIVEEQGQHDIQFYGNKLEINKEFIDDVCEKHLQEVLGKLKKPLLIMHSPIDEIVSIDHAGDMFALAKHPKSFISLNKAQHLLTKKEDATYVSNLIYNWAEPYLDIVEAPKFPSEVKGKTNSRLILKDNFLTYMNCHGHEMIADEPISLGGSNLAATPMQMLEAALASCTLMTINMYLRRKNWFADHVDCVVEKVKGEGKEIHFERTIQIKSDLTEEQRERVLNIANKCPVHRALSNEILVNTRLEEMA